MSNNSCSICPTDNENVRHTMHYVAPTDTPPTVFVDNNSGYIAYAPTPFGYKNTSLKYSNIHEAMGINFYATVDSIGACIFKEGVLISIADKTISDFFTISVGDDIEVTLLSVMQVSDDMIYLAAALNIGGGKIVFASKTLSYRGLILSIPTTVEHYSTTTSERSIHSSLFKEDGSSIGEPNEDVASYTYEDDNYSHGFGDLKIKELTGTGMQFLFDEVLKDLKGINSKLSDFSDSAYAIESFFYDETLIFIGISSSKLMILSEFKDDTSEFKEFSFGTGLKYHSENNPYSKSISYIPKSGIGKAARYAPSYVPSGVIKRYKDFSSIVFNRIESVGEGKGIGVYSILIKKNDDDNFSIDFDALSSNGSEVFATSTVAYPRATYADLQYVFHSGGRRVNVNIGDSDIVGKNKEIAHLAYPANTLSMQKVDIMSVKSMSNFMHYGKLVR